MVRVIGALKLLKGIVLGAAAVGLFTNHAIQSIFGRLFGYISERKLEAAGVATAAYAVVFLVEGVGLLLIKRWAEWLTVIVTTSFIPLEIWKLIEHTTATGIVTLALNVAVVVYLIVRLKRDKNDSPASSRPRRPAGAQARPA